VTSAAEYSRLLAKLGMMGQQAILDLHGNKLKIEVWQSCATLSPNAYSSSVLCKVSDSRFEL
jgi:hypothetical protein